MSKNPVWCWSDASGSFNVYEKSIQSKIETAFQEKKAKIDVDEERFIDLKAMQQCRNDNPKKRRQVKRILVDSTTLTTKTTDETKSV